MVASLLGITPERLRTIRRVHSKRADSSSPVGGAAGRAGWWQCVDQLGDDELFAVFRRREVRARQISRGAVASPIDRLPRRSIARR